MKLDRKISPEIFLSSYVVLGQTTRVQQKKKNNLPSKCKTRFVFVCAKAILISQLESRSLKNVKTFNFPIASRVSRFQIATGIRVSNSQTAILVSKSQAGLHVSKSQTGILVSKSQTGIYILVCTKTSEWPKCRWWSPTTRFQGPTKCPLRGGHFFIFLCLKSLV
jgi:hypothetical protein